MRQCQSMTYRTGKERLSWREQLSIRRPDRRRCIINSEAIVEHDNNLDDFAHVSVGAKLVGSVHVGEWT